MKFKGSLRNQTQQLIWKDQTTQKSTANPVKKRPRTNLWENEWEGGELNRTVRESKRIHLQSPHTHTHTLTQTLKWTV